MITGDPDEKQDHFSPLGHNAGWDFYEKVIIPFYLVIFISEILEFFLYKELCTKTKFQEMSPMLVITKRFLTEALDGK